MTVFLIRHGSAGVRNDADPDDVERHLDEVGRQQAERIADALGGGAIPEGLSGVAAPAVVRIVSSPAPRCVETVGPLAARLDLTITEAPALLEGSAVEDAWDLVESLALADGDSVLCSHGDVIPDLIRRARLRGMLVPTKSGCSKGSIWALNWEGERFETGTYVRNH